MKGVLVYLLKIWTLSKLGGTCYDRWSSIMAETSIMCCRTHVLFLFFEIKINVLLLMASSWIIYNPSLFCLFLMLFLFQVYYIYIMVGSRVKKYHFLKIMIWWERSPKNRKFLFHIWWGWKVLQGYLIGSKHALLSFIISSRKR